MKISLNEMLLIVAGKSLKKIIQNSSSYSTNNNQKSEKCVIPFKIDKGKK